MTTLILMIFYVMTTPADRLVCTLWVDMPPNKDEIYQACGPVDLPALELQATLHETGETIRGGLPAVEIYNILEHLPADDHTLGDYRLEIIEPDHVETVCAVRTQAETPMPDEIGAQCGQAAQSAHERGALTLEYAGQITIDTGPTYSCQAPELPAGPGLFQAPLSAADLETDHPYTWLGGQLIWWGVAEADCEGGYAGIDVATLTALPCGMAGAYRAVVDWQNQFDADIYNAAADYQVPARLLKGIIGVESQFWPLWNSRAETSIAQITMDGLDIALRYDQDLAKQYCAKTLWDCPNGYPRLRLAEQAAVRQALYADLTCYRCDPETARQHTAEIIPLFARILRAYRCYAVEIAGQTDPSNAWQLAAAAYHAGGECIQDGNICDLGSAYLRKIVAVIDETKDEYEL